MCHPSIAKVYHVIVILNMKGYYLLMVFSGIQLIAVVLIHYVFDVVVSTNHRFI